MTKLYIINGPMMGHSFELNGNTAFVGRAPDNDIQINDRSVSRKHLRIFRRGDQFFIEDLNSQNGTWIFGKQIEPGQECHVTEGLPIGIGSILISLVEGDSEEDLATQYSIDLLKPTGKKWRNLSQDNRRISDQRHLELIHEVSTNLMQSSHIHEIAEKIMDSIFSCLKRIDSSAILLFEKETGQLKEIMAKSKKDREGIVFTYSRTIVNRVIREGKAVMMSDTSKEEREDLSDSIEMMRVKSIMCVPLIFKSEVRGAIYVHSINVPYGFRKDDLLLLTGLSTPATVALENALLYSKSKGIEEALRRSEQKYQALVENIEDMVFTMDLDGRLIFCNPRTEMLTGYSMDTLVHMTYRDFLAPESVPVVKSQIAYLSRKRVTNPFPVTILHAEGRRVHIELTLFSLRDEEHETIEIQGVGKRIGALSRTKELPSYEEAGASL
ncbi:MAG: FHA domain-containing protein [Deltaproteobacteria bacterium]|nr:MAG: FHA domain-containing protein [Deltaproteobacteria bacterium]